MKKNSVIAIALALVMSLACLTGCGGQTSANPPSGTDLASGGVLILSVNPEIAVEYDENGVVTGVTARNDDALAIINSCEGLIGRPTRTVVSDLVVAIGEAGYFVEEVDGERRQITLEIEAGSRLPHDTFLDEVVSDVRDCVNTNVWAAPLNVENESDYGITDYADTDYGPENDGATDYDDTDYGPGNDGFTDYDRHDNDSTDYGEGSDGVTDYDGTDYDNNTDYGSGNDGVTDYDGTDYDDTDYDDSRSNYGDSAYDD